MKEMMSERLYGLAVALNKDISDVLYCLENIKHNLNLSAHLCYEIGTYGVREVDPARLCGEADEIIKRFINLVPEIERYCEYLKDCKLPMSPANPNFKNPFEALSLEDSKK